jgi:hypothetical protein
MDVHPRFFTREEIKSVIAIPKNRRTHSGTIPNIPVVSTRISRPAAPAATVGGQALGGLHRPVRADGRGVLVETRGEGTGLNCRNTEMPGGDFFEKIYS